MTFASYNQIHRFRTKKTCLKMLKHKYAAIKTFIVFTTMLLF